MDEIRPRSMIGILPKLDFIRQPITTKSVDTMQSRGYTDCPKETPRKKGYVMHLEQYDRTSSRVYLHRNQNKLHLRYSQLRQKKAYRRHTTKEKPVHYFGNSKQWSIPSHSSYSSDNAPYDFFSRKSNNWMWKKLQHTPRGWPAHFSLEKYLLE